MQRLWVRSTPPLESSAWTRLAAAARDFLCNRFLHLLMIVMFSG